MYQATRLTLVGRGVLHHGQKVPYVDITLELALFFVGELALTSQLGQLVHAGEVAVAEANR